MVTKDEALKLALDFLMTRRMGAESVIDALQEALAQPEQEPVGFVRNDGEAYWIHDSPPPGTDLYTTPPERKPLTDEQIYMNCPNWLSREQCKTWVRQIEAAHGIKE